MGSFKEMTGKHLFLDFDGVLHPNDVVKGKIFCHMPVLADALERLMCRSL